MNYFEKITSRCNELDKLGQDYLDQFDFIPSDKLAEAIAEKAYEIFKSKNKDWDKIDDLTADILDNGVAFCGVPNNGSLYYAMGYSMVSQDAHLRNLYNNYVLGLNEGELDFPVLAEKPEIKD